MRISFVYDFFNENFAGVNRSHYCSELWLHEEDGGSYGVSSPIHSGV